MENGMVFFGGYNGYGPRGDGSSWNVNTVQYL